MMTQQHVGVAISSISVGEAPNALPTCVAGVGAASSNVALGLDLGIYLHAVLILGQVGVVS